MKTNMLMKRAARVAAFVMVLGSAACSLDIAGVEEDGSCTRTLRDDSFGGFEIYCAEDLRGEEALDGRDGQE